MLRGRRPWREELDIIDRVMKAVSGLTDPEAMVQAYWEGIGELLPIEDFLALSRRGVDPPEFLITRSSRFAEEINPWTQRDRLPRLSGGLLGELAYAERPIVIDDLPAQLSPDDPARGYLEGFQSLIALPQYDAGVALNVGISLFKPGVDFDRSIVPMMHWQASLFGRGTQNLVLRNQLQHALGMLDRELQVVGEIQRSLLPREVPLLQGLEIAAHYQTSSRAGGDYYDFFPLGGGDWGVFIADVSGHGTPAAVLMAITHAIAHTRPGTHAPPGELLAHLNQHLARRYTPAHGSGSFVTAFYATIHPGRRTIAYSTAGHNPPRLVRTDDQGRAEAVELEESGGLPLGLDPAETYAERTLEMRRGDLLVLYTDGITEALAPADASGSRQAFGVERLDGVLKACAGRSADEVIARVKDAVTAFTRARPGTPPIDDQTLVVLRCRD